MTNESALLGLLAELYAERAVLRQQLAVMREDAQRLTAEVEALAETVNKRRKTTPRG